MIFHFQTIIIIIGLFQRGEFGKTEGIFKKIETEIEEKEGWNGWDNRNTARKKKLLNEKLKLVLKLGRHQGVV